MERRHPACVSGRCVYVRTVFDLCLLGSSVKSSRRGNGAVSVIGMMMRQTLLRWAGKLETGLQVRHVRHETTAT